MAYSSRTGPCFSLTDRSESFDPQHGTRLVFHRDDWLYIYMSYTVCIFGFPYICSDHGEGKDTSSGERWGFSFVYLSLPKGEESAHESHCSIVWWMLGSCMKLSVNCHVTCFQCGFFGGGFFCNPKCCATWPLGELTPSWNVPDCKDFASLCIFIFMAHFQSLFLSSCLLNENAWDI